MQQTIAAEKLFTGNEWLYNHDIVVEGGIIKSVLPSTKRTLVTDDTDTFLAPAFVDFQVYGAAQKLFAEYPAPDILQTMQEVFSKEGTCLFQPTLATNTMDVFRKGIDAVRDYWNAGGKGVHGLHLEGPWIHPDKRGAHIKELIHPPTPAEVKELLEYGKGVVKTITIAPEVCSDEVIALLSSYKIVLSAGHSNATCTQATEGFGKGISTVTHLYNAMSPLHHREPGVVGAAFNSTDATASIIPDGHHVNFTAVAVAKKLMGDRLFAITDAVTETTTGPYRHHLVDGKYECNGTLSGSALTMHKCFINLVDKVEIEVEEALRMCSLYPARALGVEYQYGKIAPGFAAQFVVLNKQLDLADVITG
jgi:N-acetylglucosamine-6-phosphate deacetylase